jgi:4-hydroxybenzoate polyprenyltransferase
MYSLLIYLNPEFWFYCVFRVLNQIRHDGDKNFLHNDFLRQRAIMIFAAFNSCTLMGFDIIFEILKLDVIFYLLLMIPFYVFIRMRFFKILENYKNVKEIIWKFFGYSYFLIFVLIIVIRFNFP